MPATALHRSSLPALMRHAAPPQAAVEHLGQSRRIRARLAECLPPARSALALGMLWGAAMAASAVANLLYDGWETSSRIAMVAIVFGLGGAMAVPIAYWLAALVAGRKRWEARLAAALIFLPLATIGMTAALYAFVYRQYFVDWPAELPSLTWITEFILGTLASFVMFGVTSARLYFPIGVIALPFAALWFARHPR
jgi:hypothetical protein